MMYEKKLLYGIGFFFNLVGLFIAITLFIILPLTIFFALEYFNRVTVTIQPPIVVEASNE